MAEDGRISLFQQQIYDWLKELYPSFTIEMEKVIVASNQRIDLWIDNLQTAVECHGIQHYKPTAFFVKSKADWDYEKAKDAKKANKLIEHGIRLVEIPYDHKMKSAEDLKQLLESIPYPENPYDDELFRDRQKEKKLEFVRELNHRRYLRNKPRK